MGDDERHEAGIEAGIEADADRFVPATEGIVVAADGTFAVDRDGVESCFGCGQSNEGGLRLRFRARRDGTVETVLRPPAYFAGVSGVLHGGIQAAVLDEVMGVAAQLSLPPDAGRRALVTAELALRFRRPVLIDAGVRARARVVAIDGADYYVHGEIVGDGDEELTTARSRWRLPG
jgi:uncharacterized protein (TIGR00369 family)